MRIRLTRRLAERIDDVDLSHRQIGDVLDLARHDAELLLAEGWAIRVVADGNGNGDRRVAVSNESARRKRPRSS